MPILDNTRANGRLECAPSPRTIARRVAAPLVNQRQKKIIPEAATSIECKGQLLWKVTFGSATTDFNNFEP
jgi:hypothetical protein